MNIIQTSVSVPYKEEYFATLQTIGFAQESENPNLLIKQLDGLYLSAYKQFEQLMIVATGGVYEYFSLKKWSETPTFVLEERWEDIDFQGIFSKLGTSVSYLDIKTLEDQLDPKEWEDVYGLRWLSYRGEEDLSYGTPNGAEHFWYQDEAPCAMKDYLDRLKTVGFPLR